jgi:hypothetical protein
MAASNAAVGWSQGQKIAIIGGSMKTLPRALSLLLVLGVAGCSSTERVYQGIYDSLRMREDIVNPPDRGLQKDPPVTYQEYDAERTRILNDRTFR